MVARVPNVKLSVNPTPRCDFAITPEALAYVSPITISRGFNPDDGILSRYLLNPRAVNA